ncbi:MAG: hypothetical protein AABY26_03370 [Nanoarchaeota archaeon]
MGNIGYVLGAFTALVDVAGFLGGAYQVSPEKVYYRDVNGDNRPDIVIKSHNGYCNLFIQQHDGTYERMDEYFAPELGKSEAQTKAQVDAEKTTIEERLKCLGK